jgi:hypothetical protein
MELRAMTEDERGAKGGLWRQFWELGPAWITAICGIVAALTAAGFITVKHITAADATGPAGQHPLTVASTAPAVKPVNSASPAPSAGALAEASAVANGTTLGKYHINLGSPYSVPLGPTQPTQADFDTNGTGDLNAAYASESLDPISPDTMVSLPAGTAPSFQACSASTVFIPGVAAPTVGASFCLVEPSRIAGVTITSMTPRVSLGLDVTVWQYVR